MTDQRGLEKPAIRQAKIVELLSDRGKTSVEKLAKKFDTSAETIRRDLTALADAGKVRKVHGGALAVSRIGEGEFGVRMRRNALAKRLIAEKAANLIRPRQTIFMDTGSTTLICAEAMARIRNLTVITNSTRIAAAIAAGSGGSDVYLLGGAYRGDNAQTVGPTAICEIARFRVDVAVLAIGALDTGGATDFSNHEADIARAMMQSADRVQLVADHSKFDRTAPFSIGPLEKFDRLVVDKHPVGGLADALERARVEVV